jgi:transposase
MASYQIRIQDGVRYICEVIAFRNKKGRPDNKKTIIGKINENDNIILNKQYLNMLINNNIKISDRIYEISLYLYERGKINKVMNKDDDEQESDVGDKSFATIDYLRKVYNFADNMNVESINDQKQFSSRQISSGQTLSFGNIHLLEELCKKIGLTQLLTQVFPKSYNKITTLMYYLISTDQPYMYCDDWLNENTGKVSASVMSSQSISQLLQSITASDRIEFFSKWAELRNESEYLALDITSISSYSNLIGEAECGNNKEHDPLDQINLCLLYGEKSVLPIYSTYYSGSLKDVSTLISTVKQVNSICNKPYKLVLDKGFFSRENIKYLLTRHSDLRFIIAVPFTFNKARDLARNTEAIAQDKNIVATPTQMFYAEKKRGLFDDIYPLSYYHYYDPSIYASKKAELYCDYTALKIKVQEDITVYDTTPDARKYLKLFRKKNFETNGEYIVQLNHTAINRKLLNTGQMVLISNDNLSTEKVIEIYRGKDVVEKGFKKMKSSLDMRRIRVHSSPVMANKEFICFLSLILYSYLDRLMANHRLYNKYSMQKMLNKFKTMKIHIINGNVIVDPPTKYLKDKFKLFEIPMPASN